MIVSYRDDVILAEISMAEGDDETAEKLVRQIIQRYPMQIRRRQIVAWLHRDKDFLDSMARMKKEEE